MNILLVVTDLFFPDQIGGGRRTLETARILSSLGHNITIFSNRRSDQNNFDMVESFKVYRNKMPELNIWLYEFVHKNRNRPLIRFFNRFLKKYIIQSPKININDTGFDSHLDIIKEYTLKDKIKELYRHKLPIHKIIKIIPSIPIMFNIIKKEKIDAIYERGPSYGLGVLMAKLTGRVAVLDFIDIMYSNWALKKADRILSYFTKFQIPAFIPRDKIDIVYMTADEKRFLPNIDTKDLRIKMGLEDNYVVGIYVGGFYKWHGLDYLVKAINIIKQNPKLLPQNKFLKIMLVGSGDEFNNIKDSIHKLNLESFFILTGKVGFDEVPKYTCLADFCCSLNSADAIGFKLVEYMACGKPTLIGPLDIVPKFFHNNDTVLYVDPTNPDDIAQKIIYIMNNLDKVKIIGQNARKLVESKYTWTQHGKTIINAIYKSRKMKPIF